MKTRNLRLNLIYLSFFVQYSIRGLTFKRIGYVRHIRHVSDNPRVKLDLKSGYIYFLSIHCKNWITLKKKTNKNK